MMALCQNLSTLLRSCSQYDLSLAFMKESNRLAEYLLGRNCKSFADSCHSLALCYYYMDMFEEATIVQKEAIKIFSTTNPGETDFLKGHFDHLRVFTEQSVKQKKSERKDPKMKTAGKFVMKGKRKVSDNRDDRPIQDLLQFIEGPSPLMEQK